MNVVAQTLSGWLIHQDDLRARVHAFARSVFVATPFALTLGPSPAPMSATRSAQGSTAAHRGSSPGVSPAPASAFLSAAGWVPALPAELCTPPPARLTASGALRPAVDAREGERRFSERRVRNDGSPYGVERRRRPEDRAIERRAAPEPPRAPASAVRLDRGPYALREDDYAPYLQDLLKRLHGR
jgi:hypothetical protein